MKKICIFIVLISILFLSGCDDIEPEDAGFQIIRVCILITTGEDIMVVEGTPLSEADDYDEDFEYLQTEEAEAESESAEAEEADTNEEPIGDLIPDNIEIPAIESMGYTLMSMTEDGGTIYKEVYSTENKMIFTYTMTRISEPYEGEVKERDSIISVNMGITSEDYSTLADYEIGERIYQNCLKSNPDSLANSGSFDDPDVWLINEESDENLLYVISEIPAYDPDENTSTINPYSNTPLMAILWPDGWNNVLGVDRTIYSYLKIEIDGAP